VARQLLAAAGAGVVGPWVRTEPPGKKVFPARVVATGDFAGDDIFIEELVGGLPGLGANSPFARTEASGPQANDTGAVLPLGSIPGGASGGALVIDHPVEFMRARTGAFTGGTVTFCGVEMTA
jgi:hypothetical protein